MLFFVIFFEKVMFLSKYFEKTGGKFEKMNIFVPTYKKFTSKKRKNGNI